MFGNKSDTSALVTDEFSGSKPFASNPFGSAPLSAKPDASSPVNSALFGA